MATVNRVTNYNLLIPFLKSKLTKKFFKKVIFYPHYFEPLPWQHQLRHELKIILKHTQIPNAKSLQVSTELL